MGVLENFLTSPATAIAAGLLRPSPSGTFGGGLSQGVQAGLAAQRANLRQEILRQEIMRQQQIQASRQQQQAALNAISIASQQPGFNARQQALQNLPALGVQRAAQLAGLAPQGPQIGNVNPSNFTPDSVARFSQTGNHGDLVQVQRAPLVQNIVGQQGFKVPAGFMMADPNNPNAGVVPIPGGPASRKSPEAAAKTALTAGALQLLPGIRNSIISQDGVDRGLIASMSANVPFSKGKLVKTQILDALEAKLRAESGAAVPETEVSRAAIRFMPSMLDSDDGIVDKLDRLEKFLSQSLEKSDPELFRQLTSKKGEPSGKVQDSKTIDGKRFMKQNGQWFEVQ